MATHGSPMFASYTENLRRLYWVEFIESQMQMTRPAEFRASLVSSPLPDSENLTASFDYHRHRASGSL